MAIHNEGFRKKMRDLIDLGFDDQIEDTIGTIRIASVLDEGHVSAEHPFGANVTEALEDFLERARRLGFKTKNLDNYAGYVEMGTGQELIGILAHLDVMPEGDLTGWRHHPYEAVIDGGELYGRGSIDDKGPAVAALYAMKALRDSGAALRRRFRLILGLDEESGSRCIAHYKEVDEIPTLSFSPDATFPVVNAEKGILRAIISKSAEVYGDGGVRLAELRGGDRFNVVPDAATVLIQCGEADEPRIDGLFAGFETSRAPGGVRITSRGVPAHAMEPQKGDNAVQKLMSRIVQLDLAQPDKDLALAMYALAGRGHSGEGLGIESSDDVSGPLTCNLAAISIEDGETGNMKKMSIKIDIRYPVTEDSERLLKRMELAVGRAGAELVLSTHKRSLYIPETHEIVRTLLDSYEAVTGDRPAPVSMGGGTYCRFMPNSVSAGPLFPGQPELAHQANERVAIEDLRRGTHIYAEALARFNEI
ncbi:MAG: dipeptidase PepV [Synergistaceae bacterium]|jgi:succinyl-diaminopimelate desuccinylase|nr:dipeptidase PepV [Synergistaceae bacterium]